MPELLNKRCTVQLQPPTTALGAGFNEFVIARMFRVSVGLVCEKLKVIAKAVARLRGKYVVMPSGREAERVAAGFAALRRGKPCLSNVCGCLDGTFVFVCVPESEHGRFIGYKHPRPAMLLMAACDHNLKFRWYDMSSVASAGDQAAVKATALPAKSAAKRARLAAEADTAASMASSQASGPEATEIKVAIDPKMLKAARSTIGTAFTERGFVDAVPDKFVMLCDGGIRDFAWMLRVGTEHDALAVRRNAMPEHQRMELAALEYCDFVISSHRIHVERAFGRFFNSFKVFRTGRFSVETMALFVDAAMVIHNFIITCLEEDEADAASGAASSSSSSSAREDIGQPPVVLGEDDKATACTVKGLGDDVAHCIDTTVHVIGDPVMALVHSEASKATVMYIQQQAESGAPVTRPGCSVDVPDTDERIEDAIRERYGAGGPPWRHSDVFRRRRRVLMDKLLEARQHFFDETGVLDAEERLKVAVLANMSLEAKLTPQSRR